LNSINKEGKNINEFYNLKEFIIENKLIEQKLYEQLIQDKSKKEEEKIKILNSSSNTSIKLTKDFDEVKKIDFISIEKQIKIIHAAKQLNL